MMMMSDIMDNVDNGRYVSNRPKSNPKTTRTGAILSSLFSLAHHVCLFRLCSHYGPAVFSSTKKVTSHLVGMEPWFVEITTININFELIA